MHDSIFWILRLTGFVLGAWLAFSTEIHYRKIHDKPILSKVHWMLSSLVCLICTGLAVSVSRDFWPPELDLFAYFAGGVILGIYRIDQLTRLIPDRLQIAGFIAGVSHLLGLGYLGEPWSELFASMAVSLGVVGLLWFLSFVYFRMRGHVGFGMGDIKFLGWLSLFMGKHLIDVLMIAVLVSLLVFVVRSSIEAWRQRKLFTIKLNETSPFGPSIIWGIVFERLLRWISFGVVLTFGAVFASSSESFAKSVSSETLCVNDKVDVIQLKKIVSTQFGKDLKIGKIRVGNQEGELLVLNVDPSQAHSALDSLSKAFPKSCSVSRSNQRMNSLMLTPAKDASDSQPLKTQAVPAFSNPSQLIRRDGYVIGLMNIPESSPILLIYPTQVASEMAKGSLLEQEAVPSTTIDVSLTLKKEFPNTAAIFQTELDIEYNFGEIKILVFSGIAKASMRESSDRVLGDLRRLGFGILKGSEAAIARLEGFLTPDSHESYWQKNNSIVRVELEKITKGRVRVQLHETRQIR